MNLDEFVEKHINDILSDIEEMNQISRGKK